MYIESRSPLFLYRGGANEKFPVMKLLFNNVIECNYFLLSRYSTFLLYDPITIPIGSNFGVGRDHGNIEKVYRIKPIPKEIMFDKLLIFDFLTSSSNVLSRNEDFQLGNFPPYKIEIITDEENNVIEREKSSSNSLLENVFLKQGDLQLRIYDTEKKRSTNYFTQQLIYKKTENGEYLDKTFKNIIVTPTVTVKNTTIEIRDNIIKYTINIKRNGEKLFNEYINKEISFEMFKESVENNNIELFKSLLQSWQINPADDDNYAIQISSYNGHLEIVKLLLQDKRVDPSADDNYAIKATSENGHLELVKLLLRDKRVDPSTEDNYIIKTASQKGYLELVKLLLQDGRVDPSAEDNFSIREASINGHREIVKLLTDFIKNKHS